MSSIGFPFSDLDDFISEKSSPPANAIGDLWDLMRAASRGRKTHEALFFANKLIGGHGVEVTTNATSWVSSYYGNIIAEYVNLGDTYIRTLLYDTAEDNFQLCSWGDFIEAWERDNPSEEEEDGEVVLGPTEGDFITSPGNGFRTVWWEIQRISPTGSKIWTKRSSLTATFKELKTELRRLYGTTNWPRVWEVDGPNNRLLIDSDGMESDEEEEDESPNDWYTTHDSRKAWRESNTEKGPSYRPGWWGKKLKGVR